MRRGLKVFAGACIAFGAIIAFAGLRTNALVEGAARRAAEESHLDFLNDGKIHAFLCGTGVPTSPKGRAGACTAILAGDQFILVDTGPGSWANISDERLPASKLSAILLTHFHSDHIADLGEAATQSWMRGRKGAINVYGPEGVEQVVGGFNAAYALDRKYRSALHGQEVMPIEGGVLQPHTVTLPATDGAAVVFEKNGLKVIAFAVDHEPGMPAFGYRFEYGGKVIVISGDTAKSENLAQHALGADVLIHEVAAKRLANTAAGALDQSGQPRLARMIRDASMSHTSPEDAVGVARQAKVKKLVFTHIAPSLSPSMPDIAMRWLFFDSLSTGFDGEVIFGKDGMWIDAGL